MRLLNWAQHVPWLAGVLVLLCVPRSHPDEPSRCAPFGTVSDVMPESAPPEMLGRLFPKGLPTAKWSQFASQGFTQPVTGVIHRRDFRPVCGAPVGAVDTGALDIEAGGTFGYSSIFNDLSPLGGPVNPIGSRRSPVRSKAMRISRKSCDRARKYATPNHPKGCGTCLSLTRTT